MAELPEIKWKGKTYTFDYRLNELRILNPRPGVPIGFIHLNNTEKELLKYAIDHRDSNLLRANMKDLEWKLPLINDWSQRDSLKKLKKMGLA